MSESSVVFATQDTSPEVKRGRGRPQVYAGLVRLYIIALIGVLGLTKTRKLLNSAGAIRNAYAKKYGVEVDKALIPHKLNISMLKLCQLGKEGAVSLQRGRPKTKVVAEAVAEAVAEVAAEVAAAPIAS